MVNKSAKKMVSEIRFLILNWDKRLLEGLEEAGWHVTLYDSTKNVYRKHNYRNRGVGFKSRKAQSHGELVKVWFPIPSSRWVREEIMMPMKVSSTFFKNEEGIMIEKVTVRWNGKVVDRYLTSEAETLEDLDRMRKYLAGYNVLETTDSMRIINSKRQNLRWK